MNAMNQHTLSHTDREWDISTPAQRRARRRYLASLAALAPRRAYVQGGAS